METDVKKRNSSERRNKRVKEDYNLESDKVRSKSRWLIRAVMRDAAIHADAWIKETDIAHKEWVSTWFGVKKASQSDLKLTSYSLKNNLQVSGCSAPFFRSILLEKINFSMEFSRIMSLKY